jgi:hypothetical protein
MEKWVLALASDKPWNASDEAALAAWAVELSHVPGIRGVEIEFLSPDEHRLHTSGTTIQREPPRWSALALVWSDPGLDAVALQPPGASAVTVLRTSERLAHDFPRDWPDGTPTPGFKKTTFWRAAPGRTAEEWQAAYADHADLVRMHHSAAWRYRQNIIQAKPDGLPYDAISELWWPKREDLARRFYDSEESKAAVSDDTDRFLDKSCTMQMVTRHMIVKAPR